MRSVINPIPKHALSVGFCALLALLGVPAACGGNDSVSAGTKHDGGGGAAGEGGATDTGDASDGDASDGDASVSCPTVAFMNPAPGATLTEADDVQAAPDAGADTCSDGFQYDVKVSTSAADGTEATLYSGTNKVATTTVAGGLATFAAAQLSIGADTLKVQIGPVSCAPAAAKVTVSCNGLPACDISKPVISATHPELNGVPVANGGDRASAAGSAYQVAFEVTTDVEDGQPVELQINSSAQLITTLAKSGKAEFPGVPLSPDGDFTVVATCRAQSGKTSESGKAKFTVDTAAPDLTVTEPAAGKHFGPGDDFDTTTPGQQFQVCASTDSADALNLPASLGAAQSNFCVALGTATPICVPVTGTTTGAPCVTLTCQDRAPFNLNLTLSDEAGNVSQAAVEGVSCTSALPGVAIVNPVDGTGADLTTHILAADATSARKDENAAKPGAQFTVVACTDVPAAPMKLLGAVKGQTPATLKTTTSVAAVAGDNCPAGKSYVGKFTGATLPESDEGVLGDLVNPTELTVTVSDQGTIGTSPPVDVWVDSVAPAIGTLTPNPLCGSLSHSTTPVKFDVILLTGAFPVQATVTNNGTSVNYSATTPDVGRADLGQVTFGLGQNEVVATTVDPAGNPGSLQSPCTVTVGNPPIMSWITPNSSNLNYSNDSDHVTSGWQGTLSVQTDLAGTGATVQFSTGAGDLGAPVAVDGTGKATTPVVTLADGASVTLTATTTDVPNRGIGTISRSVVIDTVPPAAIADLAASVPAALRRQTTFHLAWTAPADTGSSVVTYDVRVAKGTPITDANFDAQEHIAYSGAAAAAGSADGVDVPGRMIENDYYFAVAAIDKGGNRGPVASTGPAAAHFNSTLLSTGVSGELFGYVVDGSTSLDGDAYSDLIVGSYNSQTVRIYMGSATGYPSAPSATIIGATIGFGRSVAVVGDIDSDGLPDLAIGSPLEGAGNVYIFKGQHPWPTLLRQSDADYVVQAGAGFSGSFNGFTLARLGDFNNDGVDDFAISAPQYNGTLGRVSVVYGVAQGAAFGVGTPGTVSLPADYGSKALEIDGSGGVMGSQLVGIGHFFLNGGSSFVASANLSAGSVLAFHGVGAVGPVSTPDQTFTGPLAGGRTGIGLAFIGAGGTSPVVGIGSPAYNNNPANGRVDIFQGNVASGPFSGAHAVYTDSRATGVGDGFGVMVIGGGYANGTGTSFLGDSAPDVVLGALTEAGAATHVYLMTGQNAITPGTRDIVAAADVSYPMPPGWLGCSIYSGSVRDSNGDSYGDIAIGEWHRTTGFNGRVLVLW